MGSSILAKLIWCTKKKNFNPKRGGLTFSSVKLLARLSDRDRLHPFVRSANGSLLLLDHLGSRRLEKRATAARGNSGR